MKILRCAALLLVLGALLSPAVRAQAWPSVFNFSVPVACGDVAFDTLRLTEPNGEAWSVVELELLDSTVIQFDAPVALPAAVPAANPFLLPLRFAPLRRGTAVDSIIVRLRTASGRYDTIPVRVNGQGIGSEPSVSTTVLNFPRTATSTSSLRQLTLYNIGELPLVIDPTSFPVAAPYRISTPLPVVIPPGDSVSIDILFEPTVSGYFTSTSKVAGSCGTGFTMEFNGVTDLVGTGAVLRLTHASFNTLNPEQIPCGATRCGDLTIRNVGNAPLMVDSMTWLNNSGFIVTSSLSYPFFVAPNSDRTVQVCITSMKRGYTRDTLILGSNNRRSIAFGLVLDASASMTLPMYCNNIEFQRFEQEKLQAKDFVDKTLLSIPPLGIEDQLAICSYSDTGRGRNDIQFIVPLTVITPASRLAAKNSIDTTRTRIGTPTGFALAEMIDTLATSSIPNRVIVVLTDGDATDGYPVATIVAKARAAGIRIFTIGIEMIPSGRIYLGDIASGTGGQAFDASDCASLQNAFETITDMVSRGAKDYEPFELRITAPELVSNDTLRFDSLLLGTQQCRVLTVTNIGEGSATLDSVQLLALFGGVSSEYSVDPAATGVTFPITIPERTQVQLQVCFSPDSIRVRRGDGVGSYFNCSGAPLGFVLTGVGTASANLRIQDMSTVVKALPGDLITVPVYADSNLRAYDVNTISLGVRWNKTMLDLRAVLPGPAVGGVSTTAPVAFGTRDATVDMVVTGAPRIAGGGEVLAQLQFQVLRGDSLGTSIDLVRGHFADGNPFALLSGEGRIIFDSTCFRDSKPLLFDPALKVTVGTPGPQPARSGGTLRVPVNADGASWVGMALFAADGSLAVAPRTVDLASGNGTLDLQLTALPAGAYYLMVRLPSGASEIRPVIVAQ